MHDGTRNWEESRKTNIREELGRCEDSLSNYKLSAFKVQEVLLEGHRSPVAADALDHVMDTVGYYVNRINRLTTELTTLEAKHCEADTLFMMMMAD
jgi:hypothetical protein